MYNENAGKLILRLAVGLLMLFHGVAKLIHPDSLDFIRMGLSGLGLPELLAYGVYVGEVLAPLLLVAGIFSRWGGMLIVVNMLFAIGLAHTGDLFALTEHGGYRLELQMFYLLGGLAVIFLGSGRYAIKPD
ncbi:MAG TPA: DoxX family protein [Gammaproteobacteria bacterium]|jgi:putative oxidoreductase|nr:DoxX family protein [Gammaproteobacteria bacterium]